MRRLWAYILLAVTSLVLIGVSFAPLMKNTRSNMDYQSGREIVFHVESKDETRELNNDQMGELADMMANRLAKQGVSRYEVAVQGEDTITVTLSQDNDNLYNQLIQYIEFDGSFALSNSAGAYALADEFLVKGGKAKLETYNNYPCVTFPVDVDSEKYKEVLEGAKGEGAKPETQGDKESEEGATETYYLYLWYGFEEKMISPETDYANNENVIMKFAVADNAEDQYFKGSDNKLFSVLNLDSNSDGVASQAEKKVAFDTANYFVNLLNAEKLEVSDANGQTIEVTIKNIGWNVIDAWIEPVIGLGDTAYVALSRTLICLLVSLVIVSFVLVFFYRLGALAVIVSTLGTILAGLASMVLLTAEFTTASIFGFVALAIASLASGIIYMTKLKDEAYRGRSLKKANTEGGKKSLLPILDVNIVLIIVGVFAYILGGSALRTFAAITVIGGVASLILNLIVLRLMMWLATNATCLQGKYQFFGIDGNKVPDLINEEKQTYFGMFAEKDLTKNHKKFSIGGGIALLATTVAMIVFGIVTGNIYSSRVNSYNDRIYFETTMAESSQINDATIKDILNKTYVYNDADNDFTPSASEKEGAKSLASLGIVKIDNSGKQYIITDDYDEDTTYYVSVVYLNNKVNSSLRAYYDVNGDGSEIISNTGDDVNNVNSVINYAIEHRNILESVATVSLKSVKSHNVGQPNVFYIAMAALVGAAVSGLYLLIRYRLSRGLASMLLAIASGAVALGFMSLVHVPLFGGYYAISAFVIVILAYVLSILFMNRERELVIDDKNKDTSLEHRKEISIKAVSYSYTSVFVACLVATFIAILLFGFCAEALAVTYIGFVAAVILVFIINPIVIAPLANLFYGLFSNVRIAKPKKTKKTKVRKVSKSAEPEEAIFIGIND